MGVIVVCMSTLVVIFMWSVLDRASLADMVIVMVVELMNIGSYRRMRVPEHLKVFNIVRADIIQDIDISQRNDSDVTIKVHITMDPKRNYISVIIFMPVIMVSDRNITVIKEMLA